MRNRLVHITVAAILALSLGACQKRYEIVDELGISSHTLNLTQEAGSTHIMVYSTGSWTVALSKDVEWASLNKLAGEGMSEFVFSYSANYGVTRDIEIIVTRDSRVERIKVYQSGHITNPYIFLGRTKVVLPKQGTDYALELRTNLDKELDKVRARAIYYDGAQPDTLEVGDPSPKAWITSCNVSGESAHFVTLANSEGLDREADVVYYLRDATGVETQAIVRVIQTSKDPSFGLDDDSGRFFANDQTHVIPAAENNIWSLPGVSVTASQPWITEAEVVEDGLSFRTQENPGPGSREAVITVSYTSPEGLPAGDSFTVTQDDGKLLSFEELRSRVSGTIKGKLLLRGIVVSDPGSANVCSNVQTGQYQFDKSVNASTAYLESEDGEYGVCLKFASAQDNIPARWDRILLDLDGLSIMRESNPLRYTLSGITADKVTVTEQAQVPAKERKIAELTDNDIFTYVSLKDIEIVFKDGAYTNVNEEYTGKIWDVAPLLCTDPEGETISMLTNAEAPWRRTAQYDVLWYGCLPQGSGTLSGVIVSDDIAPVRWGRLGRYQIRPMNVDEIALTGPKFSNIICEWNWDGDTQTLTQDEGKGTLNKYESKTAFDLDYNNPFLPVDDSPNGRSTDKNLHGMVFKGALCLTYDWWVFEGEDAGTGRYFDVSFTTSGISCSNLAVGITWCHGFADKVFEAGGPSHWKALVSTDNAVTFEEVASLKQRSCVWNGDAAQDAVPGFTEHLFTLPSSCYGKNVVVRFQVADDTSDIEPPTGASSWKEAHGAEKGKISQGNRASVRIGTITVRYN